MPEGRELCHKLGLRRLVRAVSSASLCISLSESPSLFPSVASAALRSLQEMILLPSLPFPVFLSPLTPVEPGNTSTKTGFELLENYSDNND